MQEILPGLFHWMTFHEGIRDEIHSYYISATEPAILIDPRVPDEGLGWFEGQKRPEHIYLTNRLHYRHSDQFKDAFGCEIWCHEAGMHHFTPEQQVKPFHHGSVLPGDVEALEVNVLCPEETAYYIPYGGGIMAIGDALIRYNGGLGFVPDPLLGGHPRSVKYGLRSAFLKHLEREFDHLLFAHGSPWIEGAKKGLREFLEELRI